MKTKNKPLAANGLTWDRHEHDGREYLVLRTRPTLAQVIRLDATTQFRHEYASESRRCTNADGTTGTWEEYTARVDGGWREGRDVLRAAMQSFAVSLGRRPIFGDNETTAWDVAGSVRDIGRAIAGEPEYCTRYNEVSDDCGTMMRILVSCSCNANVSPQACAIRGAAVAALIRAIERQGISVAMDIVDESSFTRSDKPRTIVAPIRIVRAGETVSDERLALALIGADSCRRAGFRLLELVPRSWWPGAGYGCARPGLSASFAETLGYDYLIPNISAVGNRFETHDSAAAWLRDVAQSLGLTIRA